MNAPFARLILVGLSVAALIGCQSPGASAQTRSETFDSKGTKIRYLIAGTGEPLVLLHGWQGEASTWGPGTRQNPKLSPPPGMQVIAIDLRGHGLSDKPHDPASYGPEMAADVVRLLDHLKIEKAHIVGYSMGSYVAGKVVDLAPERVKSVVYGGSAPVLDIREVKGFSEADAFADAAEKGKMGEYLRERTPAGMPKPSEADADKFAAQMYGHQDVKALGAAGRSFGQLEVKADRLAKLTIPTLFLYGSKEGPYILARIAEARSVLPNAEFKTIEGKDHMTTLIDPSFGRSIVEFVGRHSK